MTVVVLLGLHLNSVARCYMLIQQLHLRPEDLLELLRHTGGRLPRDDDEFIAFKRNLLALKRIVEPHKFTRGHLALSDQEGGHEAALNTYHINGMEVSEDPAQAVEALEIEIANIRYAYPNIEPS